MAQSKDLSVSLLNTLQALRDAHIRVELDDRGEKIGYKIREAQVVDRVPYMLVIGQNEADNGLVSIRSRDTGTTETMTLEEFVAKISKETKERI